MSRSRLPNWNYGGNSENLRSSGLSRLWTILRAGWVDCEDETRSESGAEKENMAGLLENGVERTSRGWKLTEASTRGVASEEAGQTIDFGV